jgi:hypothetical protein
LPRILILSVSLGSFVQNRWLVNTPDCSLRCNALFATAVAYHTSPSPPTERGQAMFRFGNNLRRVPLASLSGPRHASHASSSTSTLLRGRHSFGNFTGHSFSSSASSASSAALFRYSSLASLSIYLASFSSHSNCESQHLVHHAQPPLPAPALPSPLPLPPQTAESTYQYVKRSLYSLWRYLKRFFYASKRITECSLVIGSAVVIAPPALYFGREEFLWQYIVDSIQYLGPTFIKLAQWASSRPDLFPSVIVNHSPPPADSSPLLTVGRSSLFTWSDFKIVSWYLPHPLSLSLLLSRLSSPSLPHLPHPLGPDLPLEHSQPYFR